MTFEEYNSRELIEAIPEALLLENHDGSIFDANSRACEVLGYEREELLKLSVKDLVPKSGPHFLPDQIKGATGDSTPLETVNIKKDGTKIPVELRGDTIKVGEEEKIIVSVRDITERKASEKSLDSTQNRLQTALSAGDMAWWEMELPSGEVRFDERKAKMLGYEPDDFNNYEDFTDLIHEDDYKKAMKAMEDHLEGRKERYEAEYRIRKHDGSYKWFRDVGGITVNSDNYTKVTGIVIDIDERKRAQQALNEERNKLKNLHDAVDLLQNQDSEENLLRTTIDVAENILEFGICGIMLVRGDKLVSEALSPGVEFGEPTSFKISEGVAGKTIKKGETVWLNDLRDHPEAKSPADRFRSIISTPIGDMGVLQVISEEVAGFDKQDVELTEILAGHLMEELSRVRLEKTLREQAILDPLTGLYNRRYFNETLQKEVQRCKRYDSQLAFIMIDVNRFKEINDRYSHQTGDETLKEIADLVKENVRSADTVVRYGGDEYLVMMPETDGEVDATVERLRSKLAKWNQQSNLLDFPLTLAMGVSHWSPDQDRGVENALKEADMKMYEDKGR